jgi:hypothetical protein
MSGHWVKDCKHLLDEIKKLEDNPQPDRLDMVRKISFTLYALQHSLGGWIEWVSNPNMMASFSLGELKDISTNLAKLTETFVEYDCTVTSRAQEEFKLKRPEVDNEAGKTKDKTGALYI